MTDLPIDLPLKTMTTKVSVGAHERLKALADRHDARMSDVLSACILHMPEEILVKILHEQKALLDGLPKSVRGVLRNRDKMSDAERDLLRKILE